MTPYKLSFC